MKMKKNLKFLEIKHANSSHVFLVRVCKINFGDEIFSQQGVDTSTGTIFTPIRSALDCRGPLGFWIP